MELIKQNLKTILLFAILAIGLIISLYLVQTKQIFKSKANATIFNSITVSELDQEGNAQRNNICQDNECQTNSRKIRLKIDLKKLEELQNNPTSDF